MGEGTGWARPGRRGLCLVTSRQRSLARWGAGARLEPVRELGEQEAAQVLLDLAPGAGDQEQAEALAGRFGGLPLALHVAGRYMGSELSRRWRAFDAYRRVLDSEPGLWGIAKSGSGALLMTRHQAGAGDHYPAGVRSEAAQRPIPAPGRSSHRGAIT